MGQRYALFPSRPKVILVFASLVKTAPPVPGLCGAALVGRGGVLVRPVVALVRRRSALVRKPRSWFFRTTAVVFSFHVRGSFVPRSWFFDGHGPRPDGGADGLHRDGRRTGRHARHDYVPPGTRRGVYARFRGGAAGVCRRVRKSPGNAVSEAWIGVCPDGAALLIPDTYSRRGRSGSWR